MTTRHLVDPELLPMLDLLPAMGVSREVLAEVRARTDAMSLAAMGEATAVVEVTEEGREPLGIGPGAEPGGDPRTEVPFKRDALSETRTGIGERFRVRGVANAAGRGRAPRSNGGWEKDGNGTQHSAGLGIVPPECDGPERSLAQVVVDRQVGRIQVSLQPGPVVHRVPDRTTQR